jgi:hypothetical protein
MLGLALSLSRFSPALFSLLVFSAHVLWAQRSSPLQEIPVQLLGTPAQLVTVSEAPAHPHFTFGGLPLSFEQNQGPTESRMRFFPHRKIGDYRPSTNTTAVFEWRGEEKYLVASAPSKWLTFAPASGKANRETIHGVDELEYYGHQIPWAGSLIVRICRQAKVHPHITSVLKALHPQF